MVRGTLDDIFLWSVFRQHTRRKHWLRNDNISWLVVGPPLWKIWVRQLGWLDTQYFWENKIDVPNHQPVSVSLQTHRRFPRNGSRTLANRNYPIPSIASSSLSPYIPMFHGNSMGPQPFVGFLSRIRYVERSHRGSASFRMPPWWTDLAGWQWSDVGWQDFLALKATLFNFFIL